MPDLISIANDLKTAPDQWLVQQSQSPSGTTPPYLVLAELQRRQLLRGGSTGKPPSTSVAQDTLAATIQQLQPPKPQGPPPPPGMAPPSKGMPSGEPGGPIPGAQPPQNMRRGGPVRFASGGYANEILRQMSIPGLIDYFSDEYGLDPQIAHAIAKIETPNYTKRAVSPKGASGPMQLIPSTFKEMGGKDIFDPVENVRAGVKYAKKMHDRYGGDLEKTLAAYNAGPGAVDKHDGVPPYRETQDYIGRAKKHFKAPPPPEPIKELGYLDEMKLRGSKQLPFTDLASQPAPQGPAERLIAAGNVGRRQGPPPPRMAPPPASPLVPGRADLVARGPMELEQPDASYQPGQIPMPGMPIEFADAVAPTRPQRGGLAAWTPPESEELKSARQRMEEAKEAHQLKIKEGGVENIGKRARAALGKETDYSKLEAAIAELTAEAERSLEPSIGRTLQTMGFALLASHQPNLGQALGEAGMHTVGVIEKHRQEARSSYIAALKAGVDLQAKKGAYNEKLASLSLGEMRLNQQDVENARKEMVTAQKDFTKIVGDSPAAQMQERSNAIKQWKASNNLDPEGPLSDEEKLYVQFGKAPTTAQDTKNTIAQKAAAGDPEAIKTLELLRGKESFQDYISGKKPTAPTATPGAPGSAALAAAPEAIRPVSMDAAAARRGTPWIQGAGRRDDSVIANLPPDEQEIVRRIADYDLELTSRTMNDPAWQNRLKAALMYDPDFSQSEYKNRQKLRQKYTSGKGADTINALTTLTEHIERTEQNWAAFDNWGGWGAAGNRPRNAIRRFFKDPRFGPWALNQEGASTEMMKLWRQAGASTQEIEQWKNALDLNASPEGQAKTISEMYHMIQGKLAAAKKEYEDGMGRPVDFHLLTPKVAERFRTHGVNYSDIDTGVEGQPAAAAAPAAAPAAKVADRAAIQDFANENKISYEKAEAFFRKKGYTIQ